MIALVGSGVALYAAGMVFNDVADRSYDGPHRPIPAGEVSVFIAIVTGVFFQLFVHRCVTPRLVLAFKPVMEAGETYHDWNRPERKLPSKRRP